MYIYIYIQYLGRDHVGLSQNNVSPNPSVESRIHDRPMCLGRMSAMLSPLSLTRSRLNQQLVVNNALHEQTGSGTGRRLDTLCTFPLNFKILPHLFGGDVMTSN